jgi:hypothetical protein
MFDSDHYIPHDRGDRTMTFTAVGPSRTEKTVDTVSDAKRLDDLGGLMKHHHTQVVCSERMAIQDAFKVGQYAVQAMALWKKLNACGQCTLSWNEWCCQKIGASDTTIRTYRRLSQNEDKLRKLPPDQHSIRSAIRFLNSFRSGKRPARSVDVTIPLLTVVETLKRYGIGNVSPEQLLAVVNEVIRAAKLTKTIKFDSQ